MTIALLCPTRKRPQWFKRMVDSARATAENKDDLRFYVGLGVDDVPSYTDDALSHVNAVITFPENIPTVFKWNQLAIKAMENKENTLFMLAADDMIFTTPCWDKELIGGRPHVYHLLDSRDENGTPHPIVSREYIEAMGYFLPPIFMHWFVDTWTVQIAKANGCFTHLKDYLLVHDKPYHRGEPDDTHMAIRKDGWLNNDMYVNQQCQHFLECEKERLRVKLCAFG